MIRALLRQLGAALSTLGEPPRPVVLTNRNQLLRVDARTEGDACGFFEEGEPGTGDCDTDGHYLCNECSKMSHFTAHRRGLAHCADCDAAGIDEDSG